MIWARTWRALPPFQGEVDAKRRVGMVCFCKRIARLIPAFAGTRLP